MFLTLAALPFRALLWLITLPFRTVGKFAGCLLSLAIGATLVFTSIWLFLSAAWAYGYQPPWLDWRAVHWLAGYLTPAALQAAGQNLVDWCSRKAHDFTTWAA